MKRATLFYVTKRYQLVGNITKGAARDGG